MRWYENPDVLAAIGSLGAVAISLVALFVSARGQAAQQMRQKREELRNALERLVTLREEQNQLNKEQDERMKATASIYQNTKRAIYLEAAEALARQIPPNDVSPSEYKVLAVENWWESDFVGARTYYEMAVQYSQHSSATTKADVLRALGGVYFVQDPAVQDIEAGRKTYERAIQALKGQTDNYSRYCQYITYRNWAGAELFVKNLTRTADLLASAYSEFLKIPSATGITWINDLRDLVYKWTYLGAAYFQARADDEAYLDKGRWAFGEAQKVIETLSTMYGSGNNNYTIEASGLTLHWWGQQEWEAGYPEKGQQFFAEAEQVYQRLSDDFVLKPLRLAEIKKAQSQAARGELPLHQAPQKPHGDASTNPEGTEYDHTATSL